MGIETIPFFNRPEVYWETRAAVVFETLVTQQLNGRW